MSDNVSCVQDCKQPVRAARADCSAGLNCTCLCVICQCLLSLKSLRYQQEWGRHIGGEGHTDGTTMERPQRQGLSDASSRQSISAAQGMKAFCDPGASLFVYYQRLRCALLCQSISIAQGRMLFVLPGLPFWFVFLGFAVGCSVSRYPLYKVGKRFVLQGLLCWCMIRGSVVRWSVSHSVTIGVHKQRDVCG